MSSESKKSVMIVDDHPVMRMGLVHLINSDPGLNVCGELGSAAEAIDFVDQADDLDLALIDISLPDRSGLELLKDLHVMNPGLRCLVISSHDESLYAERILKAGGKGYIMKDQAPDRLIEAIHVVMNGGIFLSHEMTTKLIQMIAGQGSEKTKSLSGVGALSDRELEVFRFVGEGKTSREISGEMGISIRTVDAHRTNIKKKMGYKDAAELNYEAIRWVQSQS